MDIKEDKIIIYRHLDREIFKLLEMISKTEFGVIKFNNKNMKEIKMTKGKPYQVICIEESFLLTDSGKSSKTYGD